MKLRGRFQFLIVVLSSLLMSSCELLELEEKFAVKSDIENLPSMDVRFGESSNFNLSSAQGAFVDLIFESNNEFDGTIEIYAAINTTEGTPYLVSSLESLPAEIKLDIENIKTAVSDAEISIDNGDVIYFTFKGNFDSQQVQFNGTAKSSSIICNSMISTPEDTWHGEATADNGGSFPATASAEDVKIIPLENDQYLISDISAGWFEAIGFRDVQEGIYADNCNELTWIGTGENFQFNFADPEIQGNYDPITETLTIYWYEPGNDFRGESTFTKN